MPDFYNPKIYPVDTVWSMTSVLMKHQKVIVSVQSNISRAEEQI